MDRTQIANFALRHIGDAEINSLDESTEPARVCKRFFDQSRDEALREHPWNFSIKRAVLARLSPAPLFGWNYRYELPVDWLRNIRLNDYEVWDTWQDRFVIEGREILTNQDEAKIIYVGRVENPNLFDALFVEALSLKLASKIAVNLSNSQSLKEILITEYNNLIAPMAKRIDSAESRGRRNQFFESSLVDARQDGGRSGYTTAADFNFSDY